MEWVFTKQWPGQRTKGRLKSKVLQFLQLRPEDPTKWMFIGAFEVLDEYQKEDGTVAYHYCEIPKYAPLDARAVVYYKRGQGDTQFVNDLGSNDKRREQFLEKMTLDYVAQSPISALPFPGFENVRLTYRQLVAAVENDAWKSALGSVQAVYLQTDRRTGWHYVGSAYSHKGAERGLLSRWTEYVYGDHSGGNKRLKELGARYIEDNFQYSILEIFDMNASPKSIIDREHWWMDTLGSVYRSDDELPHGYNSVAERSNNPVD